MRRDDLPEPIRRQLDWDRRRVCRAVGQGFDRLVDAGEDPTETMADVVELLNVRCSQAEARDAGRKAA